MSTSLFVIKKFNLLKSSFISIKVWTGLLTNTFGGVHPDGHCTVIGLLLLENSNYDSYAVGIDVAHLSIPS